MRNLVILVMLFTFSDNHFNILNIYLATYLLSLELKLYTYYKRLRLLTLGFLQYPVFCTKGTGLFSGDKAARA
jgi:hypothetical protein